MTKMPGTFQNVAATNGPLSAETVNQQQFPYHTFVVIDTQRWQVLRQHTLILNPQDFTQQEPVMAQVVPTLGGAYVDDFGRGPIPVSISGHSGWRLKPNPDGSGLMDGWQAFKALRNDVFRFYTDAKDNVRTYIRNPYYQMRWYNWGEDEYYSIQPTNFQLQRSASNPLYYQYNFQFTCLADIRDQMRSRPALLTNTNTSGVATPASADVGIDISNLSSVVQILSS